MQRKKVTLLDTNVILRFLLDDDPEQSPRAARFLKRVERDEERTELEDCVLCEVVWVLEKGLAVPRREIASKLSALLGLRGVRSRGKRVLLDALGRFASTTCDIAHCLLAARARSRGLEVRSFDQDFDSLGCQWREPG